jgi:hypothetical protein
VLARAPDSETNHMKPLGEGSCRQAVEAVRHSNHTALSANMDETLTHQ